jgi:septal ring-binding cell division protein DamX
MSLPTIHLAEQYFQPKIDLIQHLIQYSQNILLITAPKGGGKTAFAHFCLAHSTPQLKKHLLVITQDLSVEKMMENIAKGFGMSWPQNGPLSSEVVQKIWTLFVEDAHLLSLDMLEALVRLVNFHQEPRRQLHLVLLGESKLVDQFSANRITNLVGSYSTVIELGLPVNWAQNSSQLFSQPVLIKSESTISAPMNEKSMPSQPEFGSATVRDFEDPIEDLGSDSDTDIDLLEDITDVWPEPNTRKTHPVGGLDAYKHFFSHPIAYGLYLGAIVGIGLWAWQGKESPQYIPETQELMAINSPEPVQPISDLTTETPLADHQASIEPMPEFMSEPMTAPAMEQEQPEKSKPVLMKKPKVTAKPIQVARHKNEPIKAKAIKPKLKQVKLVNSTPSRNKVKPYQMAEKTVLAKNKDHYTVQLYGSNERQKVAEFKKTHGLDKALVVTKKHQGRTWHVLVMGDYPSKIQAQKATEHLPNSVYHAKVKPWVRNFASLQDEIVNSGNKG